MIRPSLSLSALAGLLVFPAFGQDAVTNSFPPVVVTATRLPGQTTNPEKVAANISVITREEIAQSPAFTLPELLQQQTGFSPLDTIGFGGQTAQFSLRGYGDKAGTLILVDGVRVNDAGSGFLLWNSVPLSAIDRVEIIRGGASTIYGEGAAGGVINIITRQPEDKALSGEVGASAGSLGYYQGHVSVSGRTNNFSYVVTGSRNEWAGWRDGANFRGWNFLAKPSLDTAIGKFTLGYQLHNEHSENPGQLTDAQYRSNPRQATAPEFTFNNMIHRGWLEYAKSFNEAWTVNAKAYVTKDEGNSSGFANVSTRQPGYGGTLQVDWKTEPSDRENTLTFGGEAVRQEFSQIISSGFGTTKTTLDSSTLGFFIQDAFYLTPKLSLTAGTRFDHRSSFLNIPNLFPPPPPFTGGKENNVWSPKGSLNYEFVEHASVWASVSQAYRLPSANDVVSGDPRFASNASLVPVDARTVEIGVRSSQCKYLCGTVAYYHSWVNDDIFSDPTTFSNNNADAVRQGVEVSLNSRPADGIELQAGTAWSDAHFTSGTFAGQRQVLVPEWQANAGVNFRPATGWMWRVETVYVTGQRRFNDLPNALPVQTYTVVNTKLSYQWKQWTAYAAVNNLLDRRYEQFPTYNTFAAAAMHNPAPGINFQCGLAFAF